MAPLFNVTLRGDRELIAKLNAMPGAVRQKMLVAVQSLALKLEAAVKDKLSGKVLNVRTGALRRSITSEVTSTETFVSGRIYSAGDVKYAAIQEFGGKTSAHEIVAKSGKALAFQVAGQQVFAKRVQHPGSVIPERSYLRSTLGDMRGEIEEKLRAAVLESVQLK